MRLNEKQLPNGATYAYGSNGQRVCMGSLDHGEGAQDFYSITKTNNKPTS